MYKKRFAKWGVQKNSRRSATSTPTSMTTVLSRKSRPSENLGSVPISPELGKDDSLMFLCLKSVQTWSMSFYESVKSDDGAPALIWHFPPELNQEMNFTFKLVINVLNRGHGSLAGRLARKAFLLMEEMLMLDGPALVWNMLEIMHYMVMSSHLQLLQLLLAHLMILVDGRMPKTHPLLAMLRALQVFVPSLQASMSGHSNTLLTSSPSTPSFSGDEATAADGSRHFSSAFLFLTERAWTLNAEILFDHFNDRLFQLYSSIHWDSCSIEPPPAIIDAAKQWLGHITSQNITTASSDQTEGFHQITLFEEDMMLQNLLAPPMNTSPPRNYETLRVSSIGVLRDHAESILRRGAGSAGDTTTLLRILAGLITAKILGEWPATSNLLVTRISVRSRISRGQAANVACAIRTSMDLNVEYDGLEAPGDTVGRMRSIVALREYASPEADPRVIQEMWRLEDALVGAGELQKAFDVKQTAYRRLEEYVQDIPVHFA